jgi:hypothetical protein
LHSQVFWFFLQSTGAAVVVGPVVVGPVVVGPVVVAVGRGAGPAAGGLPAVVGGTLVATWPVAVDGAGPDAGGAPEGAVGPLVDAGSEADPDPDPVPPAPPGAGADPPAGR